MEKSLCHTCQNIFTREKKIEEEQHHHSSIADLHKAAQGGCYICKLVHREISSPKEYGADEEFIKRLEADPSSVSFRCFLYTLASRPDNFLELVIETRERAAIEDLEEAVDVDELSHNSLEDDVAMNWAFYLEPVEDVDENVGSWQPPVDLRDPRLSILVSTWFNQCEQNHSNCKLQPADQSRMFQPARILDLRNINSGGIVKLLTLHSVSERPVSYVAVSHCWGKANTIKLLSSNLESLQRDGIGEDSLPISYREAIHFAQALGFNYLWIDSLCIVQDSQQGRLHEASLMDKVYEGAELCIALAGAAENNQPSFSQRPDSHIRPLRITAEWDDDDTQDYFIHDAYIGRDHTESVLAQRALGSPRESPGKTPVIAWESADLVSML